ncbi:MAG: MATE family efflux transporter [Rikenellaceae bacterium]
MTHRDSIDWGKTDINKLYFKILLPTLLGMVSGILVTIADGFFVGRYVGSDALAAVNISAPLFLFSTAFALMFGVGCSVVASVHLSKGKVKAANINVTQAIIVSAGLFSIISAYIYFNSESVALMLGATERLLPMVETYVRILSLSLVLYMMEHIGLFIIRLDGSPNVAMLCITLPSILNVIGDYLLVVVCDMGIEGAVIATAGSIAIAGFSVLIYLLFFSKTIKLYRLKLSIKSLLLTCRNIGYMVRLGSAAFLGEMAIAVMMFVGNYIFLKHYGEDGIAAYSIICYYFPIIFMVNNAISQSAQPIISYNYGAGLMDRVRKSFRLTILYGVGFATVITAAVIFFAPQMVGLFLNSSYPAYDIASYGMPLFATGYIFFALNMMFMGYYQSIEDYKTANVISVLRGYVLLIALFLVMPAVFGKVGIWLAVPTAEVITFIAIILLYNRQKRLSTNSF